MILRFVTIRNRDSHWTPIIHVIRVQPPNPLLQNSYNSPPLPYHHWPNPPYLWHSQPTTTCRIEKLHNNVNNLILLISNNLNIFSAIITTCQRCFLNNNYVFTRNAPQFNSFGHINSFGARKFIYIIILTFIRSIRKEWATLRTPYLYVTD